MLYKKRRFSASVRTNQTIQEERLPTASSHNRSCLCSIKMQLQLSLLLLFLVLCCMIVALPKPPASNATAAQLGLELRDMDLNGTSSTFFGGGGGGRVGGFDLNSIHSPIPYLYKMHCRLTPYSKSLTQRSGYGNFHRLSLPPPSLP